MTTTWYFMQEMQLKVKSKIKIKIKTKASKKKLRLKKNRNENDFKRIEISENYFLHFAFEKTENYFLHFSLISFHFQSLIFPSFFVNEFIRVAHGCHHKLGNPSLNKTP